MNIIACIVFPNTQEEIEYFSFIPEATKVVFKAVEMIWRIVVKMGMI